MEEYKNIIDFPNYQVSNLGNVKNIKTNKLLKPQLSLTIKYYTVNISNTLGNFKTKTIHRLVGEAFIPNPENYPIIDHIDRNKLNNNICNLRWVSHTDNHLNSGVRSNNTSGHTGVEYSKQKKLWGIRYKYQGKAYHGGYYETKEEAIANYFNPFI